MNPPQPQHRSEGWGQDGSCGLWPLAGGPFFFTAAVSSSQDLAGQGSALQGRGDVPALPAVPGYPDKQDSDLGVDGAGIEYH